MSLRIGVGFPLLAALLVLSACGFHLRGQQSARIPPAFTPLQIVMPGAGAGYPLVEAVRAAVTNGGGQVVEAQAGAPLLTLHGERYETRPVTVDERARVADYRLTYQVRFSVAGAEGRLLVPEQTVNLSAIYRFDPTNVLAKDREESYLRRQLQLDAAQQIVRRLAHPPRGT